MSRRRGPIWHQFSTDNFAVTTRLVKRAEAAGCPVGEITANPLIDRRSAA